MTHMFMPWKPYLCRTSPLLQLRLPTGELSPGELTPWEQVNYYEGLLGRAMNDLLYYRVFAAFRTVALMLSTYDRLESKGLASNSPDADNPYERALIKSLDEVR